MAGNRLLLLDDDPRALTLLTEIGRSRAYQVTATSTVAQFLDAYDAAAPSLVSLDLQYQDGDGIALMSVLKERGCTTPIILISGFDARVLETARRVGEANGLRIVGAFTKPIHLAAIAPLLDRFREPGADEWAAEIRAGLDEAQFSAFYQLRSTRRPAASSASRRSPAGTIRAAAWWVRTASSPWPRRRD